MGAKVDPGGIFFASLIIFGAIVAAIFMLRRTTGRDRTIGLALVGGAAGVGVINFLKYAGWLSEGPFYWTLNVAFIALFWTLTFELIRSGKGRRTN